MQGRDRKVAACTSTEESNAQHRSLSFFSSAAVVLLALPLRAQTIAYNFSWLGNSGYSMSGTFSFDAASAADGAVRDAEVLSLTFEGFLNNVSLGSNSTAHTQGDFNFNFDATAGQFFLNGNSFTDAGQRWNFQGASGIGFASGDLYSGLSTTSSDFVGFIEIPAPLVATRAVSSVPEPNSLALLSLALGAFGLMSRRRSKHSY